MSDEIIFAAQDVLAQHPLPADARARLDALEAQAPDDPRWGDLWEAYMAAGGE